MARVTFQLFAETTGAWNIVGCSENIRQGKRLSNALLSGARNFGGNSGISASICYYITSSHFQAVLWSCYLNYFTKLMDNCINL